MKNLILFSVLFAVLAVVCVYRLVKGPTAADRMVAADNADILLCCAMILFSLHSGRGVYLDIALICALFGIIDTIAVGRYLDKKGRFHNVDSDHH